MRLAHGHRAGFDFEQVGTPVVDVTSTSMSSSDRPGSRAIGSGDLVGTDEFDDHRHPECQRQIRIQRRQQLGRRSKYGLRERTEIQLHRFAFDDRRRSTRRFDLHDARLWTTFRVQPGELETVPRILPVERQRPVDAERRAQRPAFDRTQQRWCVRARVVGDFAERNVIWNDGSHGRHIASRFDALQPTRAHESTANDVGEVPLTKVRAASRFTQSAIGRTFRGGAREGQ